MHKTILWESYREESVEWLLCKARSDRCIPWGMYRFAGVQGCTSLQKTLEFDLWMTEATIPKWYTNTCINVHTYIKYTKPICYCQSNNASRFLLHFFLLASIWPINLFKVSCFLMWYCTSLMSGTAFIITSLDSFCSLYSYFYISSFVFSSYYLFQSFFFLLLSCLSPHTLFFELLAINIRSKGQIHWNKWQ